MTQSGRVPRRVLKHALWFVAALALSWLLYLVLGNSVLRQRLEAASEAAGLSLEVASARTLVPGIFVLEKVRLSDAASGWSVGARRAEFRLDLRSLFGNSLKISWLTADAVVVEIAETPRAGQQHALRGHAPRAPARLALAGTLTGQGVPPDAAKTLLVERVEASGDSLTVGKHTIQGQLRYELSAVSIHRAGAEALIAVRVTDGRLTRGGQLGATLSGRLQATIALDPSTPGVWQRARGSVDLKGKLSSIAAWTELKSSAVDLTAASHRLEFEFRAGAMRDGTATLSARRASFRHADHSRTQVSEGIRLTVTADPRQNPPMRVELRAGTVQLIDPRGSSWAKLSSVRLLARLPQANNAEKPGKLEVHAENARIAALEAAVSGPVQAAASIERFDLSQGRLELGSGELSVESALLEATAAPSTPHRLSLNLELQSALLDVDNGFQFSGDLRVNGDDAGMFLDMADASETVRWTLSLLETQPFTIRANITERDDLLILKDVKLETTSLTARGAAYKAGGETRGAFLVRGPLPIGVHLDSDGVDAEVPVDENWLQQHAGEYSAPP